MAVFTIVLAVISLFLLPIFALVSIVGKNFPDNEKLIWVLIVLFMPVLGSLLYFLVGSARQKEYMIRYSNQNYIKY